MVDGQHKLSRRALLGAVCVGPVLSRHSGLDPESMDTGRVEPDTAVFMDSGFRRNDGWDHALARFQEAQAVLDDARGEPDQDAYDALLDGHSDALCALLALPAPDLAGLAAKLDVIVAQLAWEQSGAEDCLEGVRQDARRLAASAR
ncbi:MAG TPA: hypothetical protein VFP12_01870 [Allosphingosinicella sp.]|nr:hypothetical protein [Allosphingosinicella sp.]